jgi:hypothetical protein
MPKTAMKSTFVLLFAMLASGCASQNAMSLIPEAVKLDMVREKSAKKGPVSIDTMLAKARKTKGEEKPAAAGPNVSAQIDTVQTGPAKPLETVATAEQKIPDEKSGDRPVASGDVEAPTDAEYFVADASSSTTAQSPAELFSQAQAIHAQDGQPEGSDETGQSEMVAGDMEPTAPQDDWRKILAEAEGAEVQIAGDLPTGDPMTTAALPTRPVPSGEIIPVFFDEAGLALAKDDDLKLRLMRYGKRVPVQIVVGKIEGVEGFDAMQKALALGKLIGDACGGEPGISYDPSMSAGAAELHYPAPGAKS